MTRLLLIRHGATEWNVDGRTQGQSDIPLSPVGIDQASSLAARLRMVRCDAIYSSDLRRAEQTASLIAQIWNLEVQVDRDLREIDEGETEGLPSAGVPLRWPQLAGADKFVSRRPGGESPAEVSERMIRAVARIVLKHPQQVVTVVSHQFALHCVIGATLGLEGVHLSHLRGLRPCEGIVVSAAGSDASVVFQAPRDLSGNPAYLATGRSS